MIGEHRDLGMEADADVAELAAEHADLRLRHAGEGPCLVELVALVP